MTGARLAGLVLDRWRHLPELQYRPLLKMALTALDKPKDDKPAETYWAGHRRLAETYRTWPPDDSTHDPRERERLRLQLTRRVTEQIRHGLIPAGAIEIIDTGELVRLGHAQVYRLTLDREAA